MQRTLRPFQTETLRTLDSDVHLILAAPTGSGKGVVLEELACRPHERVLLLTPLIALARQQARRFHFRGVSHHSSVGRGMMVDPGPKAGDRVWILSPESAILPRRSERIREWRPTLIAIDEAHCLEEWGESFRPAYGQLIEWVATAGFQRTLWMSATFPRVLAERLRRTIPGEWRSLGEFALPEKLSVNIERIAFSERVESIRRRLLETVRPGILFTGTRRASENYAKLLADSGRLLVPYHAGMSDEERRAIEAVLESGDSPSSPSVSATNAFGMGMDFPQLEWATLSQTPLSLLSLMQAFGRVARAGRSGTASLLWAEEDFRIGAYLVSQSTNRETAEARLKDLRGYLESSPSERETVLRTTFV